MSVCEVNFDGLVGPTHHYAGLSWGNVASAANAASRSNPRAAALQGLAKMRRLTQLGLVQAVLPPQERPDLALLRRLGWRGSDAQVLAAVAREAPRLLAASSSAAAMWTANAATVAPSTDTADGRVHLTPANLIDRFHRALEAATTTRVLRAIFRDPARFLVHDALPAHPWFGDEGAANHTRLAPAHAAAGLHLFVYGRSALGGGPAPQRYPARQTLEASQAVARLHGLDPAQTLFVQQNPAVIDAGVFHHDVIGVGNEPVLLVHEDAFLDRAGTLAALRARLPALVPVEIARDAVPLAEAVRTYLFNSQLLTLPDGRMHLLLPSECAESPQVSTALDAILADAANPIATREHLDLHESMRNGGGPACLRLRVVLNEAERAACAPGIFLDDALYARLCAWVQQHYRDRLHEADLADPALLDDNRRALDELTRLLGLGAVYPFQLDAGAGA